jgi:hypothetical protein
MKEFVDTDAQLARSLPDVEIFERQEHGTSCLH